MSSKSANCGRFIIDPKTKKRRPANETEAAIASGTVVAPPAEEPAKETAKPVSKGTKS
jgi:hypothetical protein